jgi:hypothetical protein
MQPDRFRNRIPSWRLPQPPAPQVSANGFMVCPAALLPAGREGQPLWQHVYRLAFEQAQAVVRPSFLERDPLGCWN